MRRILHQLVGVPEAPLADIQQWRPPSSYQLFRVERGVLRVHAQASEDHILDVLLAFDRGAVMRRRDS